MVDDKQMQQMAQPDDAVARALAPVDQQSPVDLLDRTWHYDCIVSPVHPSSSSSSMLDRQLPIQHLDNNSNNNNRSNNNNMKRSQADHPDIDDDEGGEDSVKPLRRVRLVALPASESSPDGYVSLSRFIGSTTDDSPHSNSSRFVASPLSIATTSSSSSSSTNGGSDATCREEERTRAFDGKSRHSSAFSRRFFNPSRISSLWLAIHN